jgi:hypothetical protein
MKKRPHGTGSLIERPSGSGQWISAYTVRARLNAGEIPGRKCGGRWLIRAIDLASYVEPNNC